MVSMWSSFSGERNWRASSQNRNQPSLIISYLGDQDYSQDLANAPPTANLSSCKVRACEQGEQWQQALDLFVAEQSVELCPDVITCNASISACEKREQWQQALGVCREVLMCDQSQSPTALQSVLARRVSNGSRHSICL